MAGTRLVIYIPAREVTRILTKSGYKVMTVRKALKTYFGWKSGEELKKSLGVRDSFLNARIAWKTEEEETRVTRVLSEALRQLSVAKDKWIDRTSGLFWSIDEGYKILAENRAKYEINKTVKETYSISAYL